MKRNWKAIHAAMDPFGECRACGDTRDLAPHHIVYRSLAGSDRPLNLLALCPPCHRAAHDKRVDVWALLSAAERANAGAEMGSAHRARVFLTPTHNPRRDA